MGNLNIDLLVSRILKEEIDNKTKGMLFEDDESDEYDGKRSSSFRWNHPKGTTVGDMIRIREPKIKERDELAIKEKGSLKKKSDKEEASEGNAFSGALNRAREKGDKSFEVDGKKYPVEEMDYLDEYECNECGDKMYESKRSKKWIQKLGGLIKENKRFKSEPYSRYNRFSGYMVSGSPKMKEELANALKISTDDIIFEEDRMQEDWGRWFLIVKINVNALPEDITEEKCWEIVSEISSKYAPLDESVNESDTKKKWIQKTDMNKGLLHKRLGIPEGDKIPVAKLKSLKAELTKKSEGDKKLSASDSKLLKQVNLALTLKGFGKNKKTLKLSENEMIDLIEKVVLEQKNNSFVKKTPEGLKKTEKMLELSKKTNDDYAKSVVKKMKDYVKYGSEGEYDESPEQFPESNYTLKKNPKAKKYMPSKAVDEYIEYFSYPGQTNITYDEIKPNDENIEKYLKGDSTTGNAVRDKKGKALGNVVPSKVGDRFMKNYDENVYGVEQSKDSYKRQSQPVEVAGEYKTNGKLRKGKGDLGKKVLDKLEESKDKKIEMVSEELNKMKGLIFYDKKTN
jgi:hypothetical protein